MAHQVLNTKDLGSVSAYGDAVEGGYDGTKQSFYNLILAIASGALTIDMGHRDITLSAANWDDGEYDLTSIFRANRYMILSVGIDGDVATGTQINSWYNAEVSICDGNILKANGDEPLVDIPVSVVYQSMIATIAALPVATGSLVYDGTIQTQTWSGYDSDELTMSGDTSGTDAGTYTTDFTPKRGYKWWDGSKTSKSVSWAIAKAQITPPTVTANLTYNGSQQSATVSAYDPNLVSVTGITGTNAGTYTATIALLDKNNCEWSDGTTADKTVQWSIAKAQVTIPTISGTFTYDGTEHTVAVSGLDSTKVDASGLSATNAGDYTATFSLKDSDNYEWTDGTIADVSYSWSIAKATGTITLSTDTVDLDDTTSSVVVTATATGSVSATSSDTSVAVTSVSGNAVTISLASTGASGVVTITVTSAATTNYTSVSTTLTAECNYVAVYGVEWTYGQNTGLTRTGASVGLADPVAALSGGNGSSPFDDIMPWAGMTVVSDSAAGELVAIPKFYYAITSDANGMSIQIASKRFTGSSVSPAHADREDGYGERDVIYVGRYHCSSSNYKSITESSRGYANLATARTNVRGLGTGISTMDYSVEITLWLLYLVEYADFNIRNTVGYCSISNWTGYTDSMVYHTGTMGGSRTQGAAVQYRHIECPWGVQQSYDGVSFDANGTIYWQKNPSDYGTTNNRINIGTLPFNNTGGYASRFNLLNDWFLIPADRNGYSNTYVCCQWFIDAFSTLQNGGVLFNYMGYSPFDFAVTGDAVSSPYRLMKLPNA